MTYLSSQKYILQKLQSSSTRLLCHQIPADTTTYNTFVNNAAWDSYLTVLWCEKKYHNLKGVWLVVTILSKVFLNIEHDYWYGCRCNEAYYLLCTVFSVFLPCSGNNSGIASFGIGLLIESRKGKPLPGTPLRLRLRKECAQRGESWMCHT